MGKMALDDSKEVFAQEVATNCSPCLKQENPEDSNTASASVALMRFCQGLLTLLSHQYLEWLSNCEGEIWAHSSIQDKVT